MNPISPQERGVLNQRGVTDAEIDEYQTLLIEPLGAEPRTLSWNDIKRKYDRLVELSLKIRKR